MAKKRMIIIGGGLLQVPAIQIAQEIGVYTIVIDYNKDAPGMKIADMPLQVSTRDVDGVVRSARDLSKQMKIDGVITVGTDASMTVAAVANALGLPGNRFEDAYAATNKIKMRERFKEHKVPQPNFYPAWSYEEAKAAFKKLKHPVVVKPADNMGARGVMKISDEGEMFNGFNRAKSASPSGEVIVEEYMDGPELSIDMLIYDGEIYVTGVADRLIERPPYFIEIGHIMPSTLPKEQLDDAIDVMKRGIRALNLKIGAAKGDIKVTKEGAMVGEIAARLSGGFMSAYTYPYATGVNLIKNAIEIALGNPPSDLKPKWNKVSIEKAFLPGTGIIDSIDGVENARKIDGVKEVFIKVKSGDLLVSPTNNLDKAGNVITVADTRDEALAIANKALEAVHFNITKESKLTKDEIKRLAYEKLRSNVNIKLEEENNNAITGLDKYTFSPSLIHEKVVPNLETTLFGMHVTQPTIIDTISNLQNSIKGIISIKDYYNDMMDAVISSDSLAILSDFGNEDIFDIALKSIKDSQRGIIMLDVNRSQELLKKRIKQAEDGGAIAVGINLSSFIKNNFEYSINDIVTKSLGEIEELVKSVSIPFILKGVYSEKDMIFANSIGISSIYIVDNSNYLLKRTDTVSDTLSSLHQLKMSNKYTTNIIVESKNCGFDSLCYLALGADMVSVTNEVFIASIGKGKKAIEYVLHSNMEDIKKSMSICGISSVRELRNNIIKRRVSV